MILPGNRGDDIRCELHLAHLNGQDEPPKYNALSYVWGDNEDAQQITLDSHPFAVARNLYAAFQYLRDTMQTRFFWIDAICINQKDEEERSEQFKIMRGIYYVAEVVVVWLAEHEGLGRGSARMKPALEEVLAEEAERMGYFENMAMDSDISYKIRTRFLETFDELVAADNTLLPRLKFVLANLYWKRVWTAQEFTSARKGSIQYGESIVEYKVLEKVVTLINKTAKDTIHLQRSPIMLREVRKIMKSFIHINKDASKFSFGDHIPPILKLCNLQNENLNFRVDLRKEVLRCRCEGSEKKVDLYSC